MKKEFYIGQPLIIKETGEQVTLIYNDGYGGFPYNVLKKDRGGYCKDYYEYEQLTPSTEFKFSELMAGLEQGYFEVGTKFKKLTSKNVLTVREGFKLYLQGERELPSLTTSCIHSTWVLVKDRKEMTLEEIEAELGYKIKLIE